MEQVSKVEGEKATFNTARQGLNQNGMRADNEQLGLSLIRQTSVMDKTEIIHETGLPAQTVSVITLALEEDGLLARAEPMRCKVGQRSLDLAPAKFLTEVQHRVRIMHPYPMPDNTVRFRASCKRNTDRGSGDCPALGVGIGPKRWVSALRKCADGKPARSLQKSARHKVSHVCLLQRLGRLLGRIGVRRSNKIV
jgi:hypothetical protein